jgi:hypothetical protein
MRWKEILAEMRSTIPQTAAFTQGAALDQALAVAQVEQLAQEETAVALTEAPAAPMPSNTPARPTNMLMPTDTGRCPTATPLAVARRKSS